jgi:hypothetical protein
VSKNQNPQTEITPPSPRTRSALMHALRGAVAKHCPLDVSPFTVWNTMMPVVRQVLDITSLSLGKDGGGLVGEEFHLPSKEANPNGLHGKYRLAKADGSPIDPGAEYFVLRLDAGGEAAHVEACRMAAATYVQWIEPFIPKLAADLRARYDLPPGLATGFQAPTWLEWFAAVKWFLLERGARIEEIQGDILENADWYKELWYQGKDAKTVADRVFDGKPSEEVAHGDACSA